MRGGGAKTSWVECGASTEKEGGRAGEGVGQELSCSIRQMFAQVIDVNMFFYIYIYCHSKKKFESTARVASEKGDFLDIYLNITLFAFDCV